MKEGLTVEQLASRITSELPKKRDFIAPTTLLHLTDDGRLELGQPEKGRVGETAPSFKLSDLALGQIGERVGIPDKYVKRM